eukprot:2278755-Rhodomonas_salina.2
MSCLGEIWRLERGRNASAGVKAAVTHFKHAATGVGNTDARHAIGSTDTPHDGGGWHRDRRPPWPRFASWHRPALHTQYY